MTLDKLLGNRNGSTTIGEVLLMGFVTGGVLGISYLGYLGVQSMNKYLNEPVVERTNVGWDEEAELFIEKDGKRFYAEIDGKTVESYVTNLDQK